MINSQRFVTILLLVMLTLSLGGCGGVPSGKLIGKWTVDRAATSQEKKPPKNIDAWVNRQLEFRDDSTLVMTDNGTSIEYVYRTPSVDDDGWMKIEAQQKVTDGGAALMAPMNAAMFKPDGSMVLRLTGEYTVVLTHAGE